MKILKKTRTRVLVISEDHQIQHDLVTMLTGYDFYVDYESSITQGIKKIRAFRHPVVIVDENCIPPTAERLLGAFYKVQQHCIVVAMAKPENRHNIYKYLEGGAHDIFELPLVAEDIHHRLERLIRLYNTKVRLNFFKFILAAIAVLFPLLLIIVWYYRSKV